jgi:3',5'-cyclic AMP phosphodiesterase CpdA
VLLPLRQEFKTCKFCALFVCRPADQETLQKEASSVQGLEHGSVFLATLPQDRDHEPAFTVEYPLPPILWLSEHIDDCPGVLVWARDGTSAFLKPHGAGDCLRELSRAADYHGDLTDILESARLGPPEMCGLLHLSDTHFGTERASDAKPSLESCLWRISDRFQRVVVTGDLCQGPTLAHLREYKDFETELMRMSRCEVINVPGNHDLRYMGSIRKVLKLFPHLNLTERVEPADDVACLFFCFNSALEESEFARGEVPERSRSDMTRGFNDLWWRERGRLESYLRIALLHHHPMQLRREDAPPATTKGAGPAARIRNPFRELRRRVSTGGKKMRENIEEAVSCLENRDEFIQWCVDQRVDLILHGHNHMQGEVTLHPDYGSDDWKPWGLTAVGCGSSTGHGDKTLSYNLVRWRRKSRRWSVWFYSSDGHDAASIRIRQVTLNTTDGSPKQADEEVFARRATDYGSAHSARPRKGRKR